MKETAINENTYFSINYYFRANQHTTETEIDDYIRQHYIRIQEDKDMGGDYINNSNRFQDRRLLMETRNKAIAKEANWASIGRFVVQAGGLITVLSTIAYFLH